jgi:hypothetical protein
MMRDQSVNKRCDGRTLTLGADMMTIMSDPTRAFLWTKIFSQPTTIAMLARHMKVMSYESLDRCKALIDAFIEGAKLKT